MIPVNKEQFRAQFPYGPYGDFNVPLRLESVTFDYAIYRGLECLLLLDEYGKYYSTRPLAGEEDMTAKPIGILDEIESLTEQAKHLIEEKELDEAEVALEKAEILLARARQLRRELYGEEV